MSTFRSEQDRLVRAAFALASTLEPTDTEVARVLARARTSQTSRRARRTATAPRLAIAAACAIALLGAGYATAPPLRAAIDGVTGTFSGWLGGHSAVAPGRPLTRRDVAPAYLRDPRYAQQPRVIAQNGGYKLFAARARNGDIEFDLGNTGYGTEESLNDAFFRDHALYVLGPGAMRHEDAHGHIPLFGITSLSVRTVVLTYASGPSTRVSGVRGGFVLLAEPARSPKAVLALDADGRIVGRQLVDSSDNWGPRIDWRQYLR